jgi:lipopolysaccharide export system protein LptC
MNVQAADAHRLAIYRRLERRNRLVAILRIGVPALGALTLVALLGQIYVSSLGSRFGISQISVTRESVSVDTPEYAGLLEDGSAYKVWAQSAAAAIDATDIIELTDAALTIDRPTGINMRADAAAARLDTTNQLVFIDGSARVEDSTGTTGVFRKSVFDWAAQTLTADGPVDIDYADGTTLKAEGMVYDAKALVWTFTRATVTLPDTPSADAEDTESP